MCPNLLLDEAQSQKESRVNVILRKRLDAKASCIWDLKTLLFSAWNILKQVLSQKIYTKKGKQIKMHPENFKLLKSLLYEKKTENVAQSEKN